MIAILQNLDMVGINDIKYYYRVKSRRNDLFSYTSNVILVQPYAPTALAAINITVNSFDAKWMAVSGATGYKVYLYQSDGTTLISTIDTNIYLTHTFGSLASGTYIYKATAYNGGGESTMSNAITVVL